MIRFHLGDDASGVRIAYQPLLEAVLSLSVIVEAQHYPLRHAWEREMRVLPLSLRREVAACSFALGKWLPTNRRWLPNPLFCLPTSSSRSFDDLLDDLRALPDETIVAELAPVRTIDERSCSGEAGDALRCARREPVEFWARLCDVIATYWETVFADEWERLEPRLAESVAEAEHLLDSGGLAAFVATLGPRVRLSTQRRGLQLELWRCPDPETTVRDLDVPITTTFTFVPSTFTWPHIWASTDPGWPIGITYQASSIVREARQPVPPADLLQLLRACGDEVRLQTLRWLAQGPRPTQELAPLVGITERALTKHLRHLSNAGLVASRRDGRYVLYRLRPEGLKPLTSGLVAYVLQRPGPPAREELAQEKPDRHEPGDIATA